MDNMHATSLSDRVDKVLKEATYKGELELLDAYFVAACIWFTKSIVESNPTASFDFNSLYGTVSRDRLETFDK